MRIVAVAALGCAVGFAFPCAAQTEQAELPQTSVIAKQSGQTALSRPAAPQLLAPPETALPAPNAPVITHAAPSHAGPSYAPTSIPVRATPEPVQEPVQEQAQPEAAFSTPERLVEW